MRRSVVTDYLGKSAFLKIFLVGGAVVISCLFVWYTFDIIGMLQNDTRDQVDKYVRLWQLAANSPTSGEELPFIFEEVIVKARFPIVVLDQDHKPVSWRNIASIPGANRSSTPTLASTTQNGRLTR